MADDLTFSTTETNGTSRFAKNRRAILLIAILLLICAAVAIVAGIFVTRTKGAGVTNAINTVDPYPLATPAPDATTSSSDTPVAPAGPYEPTTAPMGAPSFASATQTLILSVALQGGAEFNDPASYQSKALTWLIGGSAPQWSDAQQLVQRYALACIFYATNAVINSYTDKEFGTNVILPWTAATNWVTDSDECNWFGITCESEKVVSLVLFGNRLSGSFPAEVTLLKDTLTSLDISHNLLHNEGDEGNAWLGDLTNIRYLIYAYNFFQYNGIPTIISKLQQLRHYDCSYNLYAGPLTEEHFVDMPLLTFLAIRGNGYHSPIPASMVALPALTWLYAENASLTGTLDFIAGMPGLFELYLDNNDGITGTIPPTISALSSLQVLSLKSLSLAGPLPAEMDLLTSMVQLRLDGNYLTGTIPDEWNGLTSLTVLSLTENQLTGSMPLCSTGIAVDVRCDCEVVCSCCSQCT